ncbi:DNA/RNA helicase domain-containing protein [Bacillus sp. AFS077874]|uniref:DNA/RNA helicase domain-containing protein n=1 Tax=Bacillus sp. AFS077874 TaxID=2033513 RepID=UPI0015967E52|nr:DNA/RNA helicase domain-containing protein [Bacillus sp. AFS077874]
MSIVGAKLKVKDIIQLSNQNTLDNKMLDKLLCDLEKFVRNIGYKKKYKDDTKAQRMAWKKQIKFLAEKFERWNLNPELFVLFEYMLPKENTKRPDIILLFESKIISLEFKTSGNYVDDSYALQFVEYGKILQEYHQYNISKNVKVESFLIMSSVNKVDINFEKRVLDNYIPKDLDRVLGKDSLDNLFESLAHENIMTEVEVNDWIRSERGRSRKIWDEARIIKDALISGEKGALSKLNGIAYEYLKETDEFIESIIKNNNSKNLILVSGVPGAGKTLIALLQLFRNIGQGIPSRYYTGNGALISVLKGITGSNDIDYFTGFRHDYIIKNGIVDEKVVIFDEAQRFWTAEKANTSRSDAKGIIEANYNDNITIIALIGDGQKPLDGEAGIESWINALRDDNSWQIHAPTNYKEKFVVEEEKISFHEELHLSTSVRAGFTDISNFIESVLKADLIEASKQYDEIKKNGTMGVDIKICRDLNSLYVKNEDGLTRLERLKHREEKNTDNKYLYGILCSSKVEKRDLIKYSKGLVKESYQKNDQAYRWYTEKCCDVNNITVGTETFCQGLELDLPIVLFAGDYYLEKQDNSLKWKSDLSVYKKKSIPTDKEEEIMRDTYRILLTRVTKEMIIIIPNDIKFKETYNFFKKVGLEEWPKQGDQTTSILYNEPPSTQNTL